MERKIYYESTDNIKLCGLLNVVNTDKKIVILCHGLTSNKESNGFNLLVRKLEEEKINSFRFDFRSLGESSGDFINMTPQKEVSDLRTTVEYLIRLGYEEMIILGTSFGGSIVSLYDYENCNIVKGIVLWYSALDYLTFLLFYTLLSKDNKRIADKQGYYELTVNNKKYKLGKELYNEVYSLVPYKNIIKLNLPILFVHGKKDEMVPYELSIKVSKMCKRPQLELIENGNHSFKNDNKDLNKAIEITVDFIKYVLHQKN